MFSFFKKSKGILGINARNLLYVSKYNSIEAKKFADNKLYTKQFLQSRQIGVAKLYQVIKTQQELQNLNLMTLPKNFVIKPNRGYGGEGILVITKKVGKKFVSVGGETFSMEEIFYHCVDILDGKYAISGTYDQVIIEEFLENHPDFQAIVTEGLPDLRIIVFNYTPIIAMLRIPTQESQGKANLHLGAIGVGVDIGTGKTTYGIKHNQYIRKFPNGETVTNFQIPYWDDILLTASQIQQVSKIGYLAVDLAIAKNGIKVLEVNARAGLSVQIANRAFLKTRLEKVKDLKIVNSKQGIEVARTLFSGRVPVKQEIILKPVIGLYEKVILLLDRNTEVIAKINPHGVHNLIDDSLVKRSQKIFDIFLKKRRLKFTFKKVNLQNKKYKIVLAGRFLGDYLIDCKKSFPITLKNLQKQDIKMLENLDKKITEIDSKISLLSAIKPQNLIEEKEAFLKNKNFSPQFIYKSPKADFNYLLKELDKLPRQINHPLFKLYEAKREEIQTKIKLIQSLDTVKLKKYAEKLFGVTEKSLYLQARDFVHTTKIMPDQSSLFKFKDVLAYLKIFLQKNHLAHWKIKLLKDSPTDIQVNKNNIIFLKEGVSFTENRLKALVTHEIETHIYRFENGKRQPFGLFKRGTADYLTTEEGLAIYNQNKLGLNLGEKTIWPALNVITAYFSNKLSFKELFHYLKETYKLEDEVVWKLCLKTKRGLCDTSQPFTFNKDIIYFKGEKLIKQFLRKKENSLKDLYIGKIGVGDIDVIKRFDDFEVKYLPHFYE